MIIRGRKPANKFGLHPNGKHRILKILPLPSKTIHPAAATVVAVVDGFSV
jgi:hypothetical protein